MSDERLYAVRLLWVRDRGLFDEYQEQAKPFIAKHRVNIERWLMADGIEGDGMDKPDQIVVTWFKDTAAKDAFENDPEYKKVTEQLHRAAKLVTVTARSVFGD